ncbi:hypothetical protein BH23CHL2_BH23CHL2_04610 [soil metagenome]
MTRESDTSFDTNGRAEIARATGYLTLTPEPVIDRLPGPPLETSLDALIGIDEDGVVHAWNTSAEEMFGYASDEVRGRQIADLIIPPEYREAHRRGMAHYVATGESQILNKTLEVEAMRRNGERFAAMLTLTQLPGWDRRMILGAIRDISRKRASESERREIEKHFRALIEQLPVVVFINAADVHMTPLYISPQVEQMLGYTPEECLANSKLWEKSIHPDDRDFVLKEAMDCPYEQTFELEYRLISKDRRTVWVREETVTIFSDDGKPLYSQGVLVDITERKVIEERTREAEARYRSLVEQTPAITFRTSPESLFAVTYVSPQIQTILGYGPEQWLASPRLLPDRIHPEDRGSFERAVEAARETGNPFSLEYRQGTSDGRYAWISANVELVRDDAGVPLFWQGVMTDTTERRRMQDAYESLRDRYRHFADSAQDAIVAVDLDERFLAANPAFERMCGYREDELLQMKVADIVESGFLEEAREILQRLQSGEQSVTNRISARLRARNGERVVVEASASVIRSNGEVIGFQGVLRDVTERERLQIELEHQAFHDPLTGLPNRAMLLDRLRLRLAEADPYAARNAVIFLDLDNFKVINDSLGHDVGDQALIAVGKRIIGCLRDNDFVARFGGDEFVILIDVVDDCLSPVDVAQRIVDQFDDPFQVAGRDLKITASIGIAGFTDDIERPEELLRRADLAMYRSKDRGRNRYALHDIGMDRKALDRLELEADLRQAIERDELTVVYQPVVETTTGDVCGVEALVRWVHPERGLLAPDEFIPIAEKTGLIVNLDRWVLREAFREMRSWADLMGDLPLDLSVNISARQLDQPDFVAYVDTVLAMLPAGEPVTLIVEITETAMMQDVDQAMRTLEMLHARGVRVALDDFGMGYSSLAQIRHLPIDYIKIDRQFIADISGHREDLIIVSGMIDLSHALGLSVVAEGVETSVQAHLLNELDCDFAQGFYYGPPCTSEEIIRLMAADVDDPAADLRIQESAAVLAMND